MTDNFVTTDFSTETSTAFPVGYRTYARKTSDSEPRESGNQVKARTLQGLFKLGNFTEEEQHSITEYLNNDELFSSGRFMWCGGLPFSEKQENFYSLYNCSSITIETWADLAHSFNFLMQGNGSGAKLEYKNIEKLPKIVSSINLTIQGAYGDKTPGQENTEILRVRNKVVITVGDSRLSWTHAYLALLELSSTKLTTDDAWDVVVDVSNIREKGAIIKGFGGKTNPSGFVPLLQAIVKITNKAVGRQLKPLEVSLLLNEAASCTVAGNIRRSARIDQFSKEDIESGLAKTNLWTQDSEGNWSIDSEKDALRMANFTRVWHEKPTLEEIKEALTSQFYSAEGAIQFAPEAIARSNSDLLSTPELKTQFIKTYCQDQVKAKLMLLDLSFDLGLEITEKELEHRLNRYGLNPCAEILGNNFFCNLVEVHLNKLIKKPHDYIQSVFYHAGLECAALLVHEFNIEKFRYSREIDPIVGVSFTGLFDFFVTYFGSDWLLWWEAGRPSNWKSPSVCETGECAINQALFFKEEEARFLALIRESAEAGVRDYCEREGLKVPNRCTTVQPAGTKSLLTGASPGWHPPKGSRFLRRITFAKDDAVALACLDYGYNVIPAQKDKDENGALLNDPFDPRCTEWLVEIPIEVEWANLKGADQVDTSKFSVAAQFDFYMQVQQHYTTHNTSATLEYREEEIEDFANLLHQSIQNDEGYISAAMMARFDANETFPRLPFEPISKERFEKEMQGVQKRRKSDDFYQLLMQYDTKVEDFAGPSGCDGDKCLMPERK